MCSVGVSNFNADHLERIIDSSDPIRQQQNLQLADLQLDDDELRAVTAMGRADGRAVGR